MPSPYAPLSPTPPAESATINRTGREWVAESWNANFTAPEHGRPDIDHFVKLAAQHFAEAWQSLNGNATDPEFEKLRRERQAAIDACEFTPSRETALAPYRIEYLTDTAPLEYLQAINVDFLIVGVVVSAGEAACHNVAVENALRYAGFAPLGQQGEHPDRPTLTVGIDISARPDGVTITEVATSLMDAPGNMLWRQAHWYQTTDADQATTAMFVQAAIDEFIAARESTNNLNDVAAPAPPAYYPTLSVN